MRQKGTPTARNEASAPLHRYSSVLSFIGPSQGFPAGSKYYPVFFFCLATFAPCLPSAVRVFFGRCLIVFFRLAADAAFFMFFLAAAFCLVVAMAIPFRGFAACARRA